MSNLEVISRGIRTIVAGVPVAGGVVAQAWSEYEGHVQSMRLDQFFEDTKIQFEKHDAKIASVQEQVKKTGEIPALFEATVEKIRKESSDDKRKLFAEYLPKAIAMGSAVNAEEKISFVHELDTLSMTDIEIFRKFPKPGTPISVSSFGHVRGFSVPNEAAFGALVATLAKLEARGLIGETSSGQSVTMRTTVGDADSWINQWKNKYFTVLPHGAVLISILDLKP